MSDGLGVRGLAFLRRPGSLARLPPATRIVPLWPSAEFPQERLAVPRPEDFLSAADEKTIEGDVTAAIDAALRPVGPAADWKSVNLLDCLRFDLRYALRDLLKTVTIIQKAIQAGPPSVLVSDAAPADGTFPPYPYLHAALPILRAYADRRHIPFKALAPQAPTAERDNERAVPSAYAWHIARQALRHLEGGKTPVAVGPYPEFYAPLGRTWKRRGGTLVVATPLRGLIRPRTRDGYAVLPFEKTLTGQDRADVGAFSRAVVARVRESKLGDFPGPDPDVVEPIFRTHVLRRLAQVLPELATVGVAFERALHRASHAILVETVSPLGKAASRFARQWKVPVAILQHGILGDVSSYGETEGDAVAAWGSQDAEWFHSRLGLRAAPVGCPRYDGLSTGQGEEGIPAIPTIPAGRKVVMFAAQPFVPGHALASPWTNADAYAMALAAAATSVDNVLLVKWHPSQSLERLPSKPAQPTVIEVHRGDTFALLRRADVLLVVSSTVALEGMILDRPVVFLGPQDSLNAFDPPHWNAGLRAFTAAEAAHYVERLLREPVFRAATLEGQRSFLTTRYAPIDGRAAERAVDFVTAG